MHSLTVVLWRWSGSANGDWFFVGVNGPVADALSGTALMQRLETGRRSGWGSVKVQATIGRTTWSTSAFPSREHGWIIPVKATVRKAESLTEGTECLLQIAF